VQLLALFQRLSKGHKIKISDNHSYLADYNIVVNKEVEGIVLKYSNNKKTQITNPKINIEKIKKSIKRIQQVVIEISQRCNLQCAYCVYNGEYFFERKRSDLDMNFETVQTGLEYIHSILKDRYKKELKISFYGGEPLLRFDTIKKIVSYSRKLFKNWKVKYLITTNGTKINDEIIDFFVSNDFSVLISLDGPPKNHDAKRVYPNGKGTFKDIWDNILKIRKSNHKYFREKVSFSAIYSNDLPLIDTFNFFTKNRIVNKNIIRFGRVNILDNNYCRKHPFNKNYVKDLEKISSILKGKIKKSEKLENSVEKTFSNLDIMDLDKKQYSTLAGACSYSFKLFIDVSGKFQICEKINNKFSIGDVWQGFDYLKMQKLAEDFTSIIKKYCLKCVFKYLCNPCFIHFAKNGTFRFDDTYCNAQKRNISKKLGEYVLLNSLKDKIKIAADIPMVKKFHQFVMIDKGCVNTAIVDLLKGNVFQVDNETMEKFENFKYEDIKDFIEIAKREGIIIDVAPDTWIPKIYQNDTLTSKIDQLSGEFFLYLEIEEGVDLNVVKEKFENFGISQITYFGAEKIECLFPGVEIKYSKKNFDNCLQLTLVDGNFCKTDEERYYLNKKYNSCWAHKIAITKDAKFKPCIYSSIILGDLMHIDVDTLINKAKTYRYLTKDKVEKCKDCELKYVCFDCREISSRKDNNLYATNPYCQYDPYTGVWCENNRRCSLNISKESS
jgi:uncharacterized protein